MPISKSRLKSRTFKKVGRVYDQWNGWPMYEYDCQIGCSDGCCHFSCRMAALRRAGFESVARRLELNAKAQDWLRNWGKMVYCPAEHGRDAKRRKLAADIIRGMRRDELSEVQAVIGGCWAGATM